MGVCSSCESVSVATSKLILQDGKLVEFQFPVKVSYVVQKYPSCFVCDSDSMEFQDLVSAMHADEELLPGHLYFALPMSKLRYPLQPEEMAALAVKASLALAKTSDAYGCHFQERTQMVSEKQREKQRSSADGYGVGGGIGKNRRSSCKGSRHSFTSSLTVIQE